MLKNTTSLSKSGSITSSSFVSTTISTGSTYNLSDKYTVRTRCNTDSQSKKRKRASLFQIFSLKSTNSTSQLAETSSKEDLINNDDTIQVVSTLPPLPPPPNQFADDDYLNHQVPKIIDLNTKKHSLTSTKTQQFFRFLKKSVSSALPPKSPLKQLNDISTTFSESESTISNLFKFNDEQTLSSTSACTCQVNLNFAVIKQIQDEEDLIYEEVIEIDNDNNLNESSISSNNGNKVNK